MTAAEVAAAFTALSGEDALSVEKLIGGSPNSSWGVSTASSRYAVRFYPPTWGKFQASLSAFLAASGYPVPSVVHALEYETSYLLAVAWISGVPLAEVLMQAPERTEALGRAFGALHAQLHALPVPPALREKVARLENPCAGTALLHLDYHPLNVLVEDGRVSGVIDWENVRLGDPRADVARTLSTLAVDPAVRALPPEVRKGLRAFRRAYYAGYIEAAAADALRDMAPFLAWAGDFMVRDLGKRYETGALKPVRRWTARWQGRGSG